MFPDLPDKAGCGSSSGAFLSCSADNTIRLWHMDEWTRSQNILSTVSSAFEMRSGSSVSQKNDFFINGCSTGSSECNLRQWKCYCLDGSRLLSEHKYRQGRWGTDGRNQDGHQNHLLKSRWQTPGVWRSQWDAEVRQEGWTWVQRRAEVTSDL